MLPIHQLLSRIQWDREFGSGTFEIGYYDRIRKEIVRIPYSRLIFAPGDHFAVSMMDDEGVVRSIPLHRIREVYKNRRLIWKRPDRGR